VFTGCSNVSISTDALVESTIDSVFETKENREVQSDTARWENGESLHHHRSVDHLKSHRQDIQFQTWEKERYLDQLAEQANQQRQIERMNKEREMYEHLKTIPIDSGLSCTTNSP
jgi:hypothetical protein